MDSSHSLTSVRPALLHCASLLLAGFLISGRLAAAPLELPAEWPLGIDSRLIFELDGADLHLTDRADGLPMLSARVMAVEESAALDSAALDVVSSGGSLTVRRSGGGEGEVPRLRIDVALGPGRTVEITGVDLAVHAEDSLPAGSGGSSVRLAIERSTAKLSRVRISGLEAVASSVTLTGTQGDLALTLTGGSARIQGHQGRLELVARGTDASVIDHQGQIVPELEGGSLEISAGEGSFGATVADARLSFDDWRGPVEVRAQDTTIEARGTEHRDRWQLDGSDLQIILEGVLGTVLGTLEGGSLSASGLSAAVQMTANGTRLDLTEVVGGVTLHLAEEAEAVIVGVTGGLTADLRYSRLEVERVGRLRLTGRGADVTARDIASLEPLELSESELVLDLRDNPQAASLDLSGAGYSSVRLKEPCIVQIRGMEETFGRQIEVTGCELRTPGQEASRRQDRLKYGDALTTRLTVTVGVDSVLDVEGEL